MQGLKIDVHRIHFFPQGIEKSFPNLIAIYMNDGSLSELHQSDLQPFPQLRYLDFFENQLERIESDLFKFNSELEVIWLSDNRIKFIDPNVFDHLTKLTHLFLMDNVCIQQSETNRSHVLKLIENVRKYCGSDANYTTIKPWMLPTGYTVPDDTMRFAEVSNNLKNCEENLDMAHGVMSAMNMVAEMKEFEFQDEISRIKKTRNILWFFVVVLGIATVAMGVYVKKRRVVEGFARGYML